MRSDTISIEPRMAARLACVALLAAAAAGCTPERRDSGGCSSDDDCGDDEECSDGECVLRGGGGDAADAGPGPDGAGPESDADQPPPEDAGGQDAADVPVDTGPADTGPQPDVEMRCQSDDDCELGEHCDAPSGECIGDPDCDFCDAPHPCLPAEGRPRTCDFRYGNAGCCRPSCVGDVDCPADQYCDFGISDCAVGCRVGGCEPGFVCDLDTRACRVGCLEDAGCPEGERCDPDQLVCTTGCLADEECGEGRVCHREPHRCVPACIRDADCVEGRRCWAELGGCIVPPTTCLAAGECPEDAPEGAACDPYSGACRVPLEVACTTGADCEDGQACVPQDDALACASAVGEGGPAAACEQDGDCASSICLNDGVCWVACAEPADCGEGLRCWEARFLISLSEDLMDPGGDEVLVVATCRAPPAPCLRPADCEDPARECLPWLDPDSGEVSPACLFGAAGERAAGEHCSSDDECVTGICTPDDICLQVCEEDGECGEGRLCGTVDVRVGEVDGEVPACVPDPGSGDPCTRDAGCPDGEACRPEPGPGEDEVVLVCRPVLGEGAPTDRCELPWDCRSGHCMPSASDPRIRSCFGACTEEADCGGLPCEDQPVGLPEREEVAVAACLDPHQPCTRDAGCPLEGWVCTPAADPDDAGVLAPVCDEPAGEGAGGAECEADEDCRSGLCLVDLETPVCWQACEADEDCPEGTRCYEDLVSVPVEGGSSTVPACAPDRGTLTPCTNDAACGDDEVCSAMPDGVRETLRTRCVLPADPPPEECQNLERGDCLSGVCFEPNPQIPVPVCLELCEAEADCPVVLVVVQVPCQPKTVTVDGVSSVVLACSLL